MVLEQAILDVSPGHETEFEEAFAQARTIIGSVRGFLSLELHRSLEQPTRYLLLVRWSRLEDHTVGFRKSPEYRRWSELLHHFYDPFPEVAHFALVMREERPTT